MVRSKFHFKIFWQRVGGGSLALGYFLFSVLSIPSISYSKSLIVNWRDGTQAQKANPLEGEIRSHLIKEFENNEGFLSRQEEQKLVEGIQKDLLGQNNKNQPFSLDAVGSHLIAARKAYYQFQFPNCLNHIGKAQKILFDQKPKAYVYGPVPYQIFLLNGMCHLAHQNQVNAKEAFGKAILLKPKEYLSPIHFSPEVIDLYEKVRKEFQKQFRSSKKATLILSSHPPFSDVYLNDEFQGQTPLTLNDLPLGIHFLQVVQKGYTPYFERISLSSKKETQLRMQLSPYSLSEEKSPDIPFSLVTRYSKGDPEWLGEIYFLGGTLNVKELFLVHLETLDLDYRIHLDQIDLTKRKLLQSQTKEFLLMENSSKKVVSEMVQNFKETLNAKQSSTHVVLADFKEEDLQKPLGNIPLQTESANEMPEFFDSPSQQEPLARAHDVRPKPKKFYQKWWFWPAVAVVVAGVATGTAIAMSSGSGSSDGVFIGSNQ